MKYLDKDFIIYSDNHLLVVKKEANLLTQMDNTDNISLEEMAKEWIKKTSAKEKPKVFLHCIHRLDKPVSGIVVFAKTSKALERLNLQMREKKIRRIYVALVEGILLKGGILKNFIKKENFRSKIVNEFDADGVIAILSFVVLKNDEKNNRTFVEIELETGRYHQIRAQFSHIKHPIIGDEKYNSHIKNERILLHQKEISFEHPVTKERLIFIWNPPF